MSNLKRYIEDTYNPYTSDYRLSIEGLRFEGLDKPRYKGLSIIYITAFPRPIAKVDKSTNLHIYNWSISPMHEKKGLSSLSQYVRRFQTTVYKRHTNIPIGIQTICPGYKGLDGLDNMGK